MKMLQVDWFRPRVPRVRQIYTGLGAGNIGDEIMARAFWREWPQEIPLEVMLAHESRLQRAAYPPPHNYIRSEEHNHRSRPKAGLIVGTTPITEAEGPYALQGLAEGLQYFHNRCLPVDALGVGVDRLIGREARELFSAAVRPVVRTWSVRSQHCRNALIDLGVAAERIQIGADWSWLYQRQENCSEWAREQWHKLGVDFSRPLVVVNVVNLIWDKCTESRNATAIALDHISEVNNAQIAFFCNESRPDPWADSAAAHDLASRMRHPTIMVPALYYSPDEALALLAQATITVGQRYHFVVASVLAGTVPVAIPRLQKMASLIEDLQCPASGQIDSVDADHLIRTLIEVLETRREWLQILDASRRRLAQRALANICLIRKWPPYAQRWSGQEAGSSLLDSRCRHV
jgi:polysaccharide pyruvyl transferase WcaK-like protein